ncbi:MAG: hypothetical protein ACJ790_05670 [Myxococcaceae bacterium]
MNPKTLALGLSLVAASSFAQTPDAKKLNSDAMDAYKAADWDTAIAKFQGAIQADPTYALPHYNLACTLSLVRKAGQTCQHEAYRHTIVSELEKSVKLDPKRRDRMKKDADLQSVRDTIGYQKLMGVNPDTKDGLQTLLLNVSWWDKGQGAFGSIHSLKFLAGGKAKLTEKQMNDEGEMKTVSFDGTWSLEDAKNSLGAPSFKVRLNLPKRGKDVAKSMTGVFTGTMIDFHDAGMAFLDEPDECSA